jgi:hypothetical protein
VVVVAAAAAAAAAAAVVVAVVVVVAPAAAAAVVVVVVVVDDRDQLHSHQLQSRFAHVRSIEYLPMMDRGAWWTDTHGAANHGVEGRASWQRPADDA